MRIGVGIWVVWFVVAGPLHADPPKNVLIGKNMSQTLVVENLKRVAVANAKIAKARAVPPNKILLTGKKPGKTMVRAWSKDGNETAFSITVLPSHLDEPKRGGGDVVRVALEFVEVDTTTSERFGIRWPDMLEARAGATMQGAMNSTTGLNYSVTFSSAKGFIEQLVSEGWAHVLARPNLYVRLGEQVIFHSGGEFPVTSSSEKFGTYYRRVDWKPFGLTVKIRPESADRLNLSSDIEIDISERSSHVSTEGIPALTKRKLVTKMNSRHGETVILSGLIRQMTSKSQEGIPWLSSIPIIGWIFFSRKKEFRQGSEVLLAMTLSFKTQARHQLELEEARERLKVED